MCVQCMGGCIWAKTGLKIFVVGIDYGNLFRFCQKAWLVWQRQRSKGLFLCGMVPLHLYVWDVYKGIPEHDSLATTVPCTVFYTHCQGCQKEPAAATLLWKMIEDIKGCQPEVKASKSDKWLRSYDHFKICMVSDPYWQGTDAYSSPRRRLLRKFLTTLVSLHSDGNFLSKTPLFTLSVCMQL